MTEEEKKQKEKEDKEAKESTAPAFDADAFLAKFTGVVKVSIDDAVKPLKKALADQDKVVKGLTEKLTEAEKKAQEKLQEETLTEETTTEDPTTEPGKEGDGKKKKALSSAELRVKAMQLQLDKLQKQLLDGEEQSKEKDRKLLLSTKTNSVNNAVNNPDLKWASPTIKESIRRQVEMDSIVNEEGVVVITDENIPVATHVKALYDADPYLQLSRAGGGSGNTDKTKEKPADKVAALMDKDPTLLTQEEKKLVINYMSGNYSSK